MKSGNMRIAVNGWVLRNKQLDGIGNFTVQTLSRMMRENGDVHFDLLCDRNFKNDYFDFENVTCHYVFPPYRHPALYVIYMELFLPFILKRLKPDLLLSMDGFLSLGSSVPQVPVIYDLNFEYYPQDHKWRNRVYYRSFFKRFARKAIRIATISEFSKSDIVRLYGIDKAKIDNVSCGIKEKFMPLSENDKARVRQQHSFGCPYFFFVGSMHPRKNIIRLMEAFDIFKADTGSDYKLILSGHILWDDKNILSAMEKLKFKSDIVFTGRVSDEELNGLLGAAACLSFVPTFEGFGLPIVEAFQSEVPVICSNTTSMPEVAGDATILVNPFDVTEIAQAMKTIFRNEGGLCASLVEKGRKQKLKFSWDLTAASLMQCIRLAYAEKQA